MTWQLYEGDCFDYLPAIEDGSVDMVLCDLPYGTTACKWDTPLPLDKLWEQYERIIKDNGAIVLTGSQPFTTTLITSNKDLFRYCWVWDKVSCSGHLLAKKQPLRAYEDIVIFYKKQPTYNPILREKPKKDIRHNHIPVHHKSEVLGFNSHYNAFDNRVIPKDKSYPTNVIRLNNYGKGVKRLHPTQKPVALFEYLIKTYTNIGDTVLDNCAGSGTTGVACYNTGRRCIMMEKEPEYCEIIRQRMREVTSQTKLPVGVI